MCHKTFLEVLFRGMHWFRFWGQLQLSEEKKECIYKACQTLETSALAFFSLMGGGLRTDFCLFCESTLNISVRVSL